MPSRGLFVLLTAEKTMVSPNWQVAWPAAWRANRPVSNVMVWSPRATRTVVVFFIVLLSSLLLTSFFFV